MESPLLTGVCREAIAPEPAGTLTECRPQFLGSRIRIQHRAGTGIRQVNSSGSNAREVASGRGRFPRPTEYTGGDVALRLRGVIRPGGGLVAGSGQAPTPELPGCDGPVTGSLTPPREDRQCPCLRAEGRQQFLTKLCGVNAAGVTTPDRAPACTRLGRTARARAALRLRSVPPATRTAPVRCAGGRGE